MKQSITLIIIFVALIWAIYLLSLWLPIQQYGIVPRTTEGLIGIVSAPFLHGSLSHLMGNSISFTLFAALLVLLKEQKLSTKLILMAMMTGLLTWLLARSANHIGASGLIFALFGYLILSGWFARKIKYIVVSLLVIFFYGGMIFGVLPLKVGVSWESHLFGFISGALVSWFYHRKKN